MEILNNQIHNWKKQHLLLLAVPLAILYCYYTIFISLFYKWYQNSMYSYGFFIPPISMYLIWIKRRDLCSIKPNPDFYTGTFILILWFSILYAGKVGNILIIQQLSIIPCLMGTIIMIYGRNTYSLIWFPIFYLIFMVPIWDELINPFHPLFQIISATVGVNILKIFDIPVHQINYLIELPNITLEVADVCSGINYLISIVALAIPICHIYITNWKKKIIIFILSVVIAIFSNSMRVTLVALFSYYRGESIGSGIHGPFDILRALSISFIGFLSLFIGVWLLKDKKDIYPYENNDEQFSSKNYFTVKTLFNISKKQNYHILLSIIIILFMGTIINYYKYNAVPLNIKFEKFPDHIGGWSGKETGKDFIPSEFGEMNISDELTRVYRNKNGEEIKVYVGYYEYQDQNKKLINYKLDNIFKHSIKNEIEVENITKVNRFLNITKEDDSVILYWIVINRWIVNDKYEARSKMIWNSIMHRSSNASIVLLKFKDDNNEDYRTKSSRYNGFIQEFSQTLKNFLPVK